MTWVDYTLLGVIGVSALLSLMRGALREILSLVAWAGAFGVAIWFSPSLADVLSRYSSLASVRYAMAFAGLFLVTLVLIFLINHLIVQAVQHSGGGGMDRLLGFLFGAARGMMVVVALVTAGSVIHLNEYGWWKQSVVIHHTDNAVVWMRRAAQEAFTGGVT